MSSFPGRELIQRAAKARLYFGTSSWKYAGWCGLVYERPYESPKKFEQQCLEEYATIFPCVGVDHTYYDWPRLSTMAGYAKQTPEEFRFCFKVTEAVTVPEFPRLPRYGARAGMKNPEFLDAAVFRERFLGPLSELGGRVGCLIFEFSQFRPGSILSGRDFLAKISEFFLSIPEEERKLCSVEIRNAAWVKPEYFQRLHELGVAHTFNSWTRMPPIREQWKAAEATPPPFFVARALLESGVKYEDAVEAFAPYDQVQKPQPEIRAGLLLLSKEALARQAAAFLLVNNRAEGCAPKTIEAVLEELFG